MSKIFLTLFLVLGLFSAGLIPQEPPPASWSIGAKGPELVNRILVVCCSTGCDTWLNNKGFIFASSIEVHTYNLGDRESSQATGKIEFYDLYNSKKIFNFNIPPTRAKDFARPQFRLEGPLIIKKTSGVKVTVTYKNIRGISVTKSMTFIGCGWSEWGKEI